MCSLLPPLGCAHFLLFAVDPPSDSAWGPLWTTNQVLYALGALIIPAIGAGIFFLQLIYRHARDRVQQAEKDRELVTRERNSVLDKLSRQTPSYDELRRKAGDLERERDRVKEKLRRLLKKGSNKGLEDALTNLEQVQQKVQHLQGELAAEKDNGATKDQQHLRTRQELEGEYQAAMEKLQGDLETVQAQLEEYQAELNQKERRINKALKTEGQSWSVKALQSVPKFRPMAQRRRAIISVCNLKGGVGKTTVTAHLGAAFVRKGYRVLFVDLDLQGSLSGLFLHNDVIYTRSDEHKLLQDFLHKAATDCTTKILDYVAPVMNGKAGIVATTDKLAYAEMTLTLKWLLLSGERDARFLLRKALHLLGVSREYDIVLMDCPPLLNISCINALAASDYLLVPVTPSPKVALRVSAFLRKLRDERFRRNVNHHLEVLGLVANRTWGRSFSADEGALWAALLEQCTDSWTSKVHGFDTIIPRSQAIAEHEKEESILTESGTKLQPYFDSLASEIHEVLPNECRRFPSLFASHE